jgi:hypothetical protein
MQSLLESIADNLEHASPRHLSQIRKFCTDLMTLVYCVVRLRLPHDDLINSVTTLLEVSIDKLSPKDVAICGWAFARTKLPSDS